MRVVPSLFFLIPCMLGMLFLSGCCSLFNDGSGSGYPAQQNTTVQQITAPASQVQKEWTILVYMNGDNDLEDAAMDDFLEIETVGSTDQVNIVVQMDRGLTTEKKYGGWTTTKRFLVQKGNGRFPVTQEVMDAGEVDSGSIAALSDFVIWGMQKYPARKYALGFWDHGAGWRGLLVDETSKSEMNMSGLRGAMSRIKQATGRNIDVVTFDMCLMGQYDVMLEIAPYADYMVASEELVPNDGLDYSAVLGGLAANPSMSPGQFAIHEVDAYEATYKNTDEQSTLSVIDLSKSGTLAQKVSNLAIALNSEAAGSWKDATDSMKYAEHYPLGLKHTIIFSFADLYDFTTMLQAIYKPASGVQAAAGELQAALNSTIVKSYKHRSHPHSHGLSFYFQPSRLIYKQAQEDEYVETSAYGNAAWRAFLSTYYSLENFSSMPSAVTSISTSASASLSKPLEFNYTVEANGVESNSWLLFAKEGGETVVIRQIDTRAETVLSNGRIVYGVADGTIHATGRLSPVDIKVSDGTKSVRATIDKRWPGMNYFVVSGTLQKRNGRQENIDLFFSERNGKYSKAYVYYNDISGALVPREIVLESGDLFAPDVKVLKDGAIVGKNGQMLVFSSTAPFTLSWDVLPHGNYLLGVLVEDITGRETNVIVQFSVSGQPALVGLTSADMSSYWDCYAVSARSGAVVKYFELDLSGTGCNFRDASGPSVCSITYSTPNVPHIYLYHYRNDETLKYVVSRDSYGLWLYENSGWNPYRCVLHGSTAPGKSIFP